MRQVVLACACHRLHGGLLSAQNRATLRHIIGLERWGQRRPRTALGEPEAKDEHHPYKPAASTPWLELTQAFGDTRAATVSLAEQLAAQADPAARVMHNQFGPLTVRGWLRYLTTHGTFEGRRLR